MDKYLYLTLILFTISFPLIRSFEPKIQYAKKWYALFPAIIITGTLFVIWDHWFTVMGVWEFNPRYNMGIYILDLPIEEWMFFIVVPFSCVFIYEVLNYFVEKDILGKIAKPLTVILVLCFVGIGLMNLDRMYTSVNFPIAAAVLIIHFMLFGVKYLGRFYLTYLVHLIPFAIMNGILTGSFIEEPVVLYNNLENLSIRFFTIPVEDFVYSMTLLLINISIYEAIKNRKHFKLAKVNTL
ncbi:hypothetical protein P872_05315 [Rhodonellum psychrophilum GCM71 = DSM 17998]|uniref:Lycopene cyclase domain-containing protein n=2 Tax=Rhodonellum TaxID=336827 RepID=U5BYG4_9BACT|nr:MULTISPECIES: lycopene cyclase domain-containing protein [Rhodonellum]ERM82868.1 hypothetical protein P872_05315 [Rhodonellum psychrophilum GCM71 = DSM 17998]SDY46582.1 lycopene cyclase domain-containing protein [Rhodonellum ikkaensis]